MAAIPVKYLIFRCTWTYRTRRTPSMYQSEVTVVEVVVVVDDAI